MAAPKENRFWMLRSKHGRDKLFKSPELLLEAAYEYFDYCDKNPLIEIEYNGKDAKRCQLPKMRAYTLTGLCIRLQCNSAYFRNFKANLAKKKGKQTKLNKDFSSVITRIEEIIYTQKFEGAAAGFLNANIISRDLGLIDKAEVEHSGDFDITLKL